jgi:hypothetical protein
MTNHYHYVLELTRERSLSWGMHWLDGTYAQAFNRRHRRVVKSEGLTPIDAGCPQLHPEKGRHAVDRCGGLSLFQTDSIASHHQPNATATDLFRHARMIVDGNLREAVPGFLYGSPGTLYRLHVDHVLRSDDGIPAAGGEVWFFFPYARIPFAGGTLCVDVPKVRPPQSGRRVLLFGYLAPMGPDHNIIAVNASYELVVEEQGGTAEMPASLRTLGSGFDEVTEAVTKLVQAEVPNADR